jgi:hypothetical protein
MKLSNLFEVELSGPELYSGPDECDRYFELPWGKLRTLKGYVPKIVRGNFNCAGNHLSDLKDGPTEVDGWYRCSENFLTTLEGAPKKVGSIFNCYNNRLTSLEGIHKILHEVVDLKGFNQVAFYAHENPIKSHVLGLLLIKGLEYVKLDNKEVEKILNLHLPNKIGNKGLLACQSALLDAGFDDFAQL